MIIRDLFPYGFPRKWRARPYRSYDNLVIFLPGVLRPFSTEEPLGVLPVSHGGWSPSKFNFWFCDMLLDFVLQWVFGCLNFILVLSIFWHENSEIFVQSNYFGITLHFLLIWVFGSCQVSESFSNFRLVFIAFHLRFVSGVFFDSGSNFRTHSIFCCYIFSCWPGNYETPDRGNFPPCWSKMADRVMAPSKRVPYTPFRNSFT